jgi:hypothetical protein
MKISGFSFLRNGAKLHYPIIESIRSALPVVDEFVIALGDSDPDDDTREKIEALGSDKIILIDTVWNLDQFPNGTVYAQQTDVAKSHCSGDWLLYLQGDEVLHEDDAEKISAACERWNDHPTVEALLFDYLHFWGDYDHVFDSQRWYKQEMRVIRNIPEIHSMNDAQSFRHIANFDGRSYHDKTGTRKLVAVHSGARIFHYGWVRPPVRMQTKTDAFNRHHQDSEAATARAEPIAEKPFDYGPLGRVPRFQGSHPAVMTDRIAQMNWADSLHQGRNRLPGSVPHRHEHFKYKLTDFVSRCFFGGRHLFASRNYTMLPGVPLPRKTNSATRREE